MAPTRKQRTDREPGDSNAHKPAPTALSPKVLQASKNSTTSDSPCVHTYVSVRDASHSNHNRIELRASPLLSYILKHFSSLKTTSSFQCKIHSGVVYEVIQGQDSLGTELRLPQNLAQHSRLLHCGCKLWNKKKLPKQPCIT